MVNSIVSNLLSICCYIFCCMFSSMYLNRISNFVNPSMASSSTVISHFTAMPGSLGQVIRYLLQSFPAFIICCSSSRSISSSGRRCPDVSAKLMPVLRHSACRCNRTEHVCDVFLPSLSWLSSASFLLLPVLIWTNILGSTHVYFHDHSHSIFPSAALLDHIPLINPSS